jgi:AcrR family transcriptional regulator
VRISDAELLARHGVAFSLRTCYPVGAATLRGEMDRRKPGPEPRFTREELACRALAIMDDHGGEGLTMRALAEALGMGTMALYRYFPSKNELMDAAIDLAAGEIDLPEREARSWKEQLAGVARELFDAGVRHPSLARERFNRPLQSPGAMRVTDHAVALLLEAGLSRRDAVAAFKALVIHALGAAALVASESRPDVRRKASERHASLPAEELPAFAAVANEFTAALGGQQAFDLGLAALLDGIELRAAH